MSYLGDGTFVVDAELRSRLPLDDDAVIVPVAQEAYAANCVRINDVVLVPSGYPRLEAEIERRGLRVVPLEMSEFQKMDGGLSCLSIRF